MTSTLQFKNVSFTYPDKEDFVFSNLDITLPRGVTSLIGQNGVGKSTFMLLGAGRLLPTTGDIFVLGHNTKDMTDEVQKNLLVSFVYQNMEFETEDNFGDLLPFVYDSGNKISPYDDIRNAIVKNFELEKTLSKKTQHMSKGELQRAVMAFSLLYGSPIVMMDEPVFALEEEQKHHSLGFIKEYAMQKDISVFYSIHELELSQKYSDNIGLFFKDRHIEVGSTDSLYNKEKIEEAYQVPFVLLHKKESIFREQLKGDELSEEMKDYLRKN
ncbi:ATP-binding cassette domain-containing protein [Spirochaeta cellobiosiphila]|uniref:ATP-binding cassette domain-containing protein n=1 Tax=Spirochaeta cellobiosiphila TaxID=504483 RepID=UPI00040A217C|nr:ABC transporter ATP-binding protein [Spirochaeta cellobiosiphila]